MTQIMREPTTQPGPKEPRLAWKAWEELWDRAAAKGDIHLLAKLVGEKIDTQAKQDGAERVFYDFAEHPQHYEGKLMRLLLTHGAKVPPTMIASLCRCGVRAMQLMEDHGVELSTPNFAGENALSLVCMVGDEDKFKQAWKYLRQRGLDPNHMDDMMETAMDTVGKYGRGQAVEQVEEDLRLEAQAMDTAQELEGHTANKSRKRRNRRL